MTSSVGLFTATELGCLELQVLLATIRLRPHAYGKAVRAEIGAVTGRAVCLSSVYAVLRKLERVGRLTRAVGVPGLKSGQRSTFCFFVTARGAEALKRSLVAIDALRSEVDLEVRSRPSRLDCSLRSAKVGSSVSVAETGTQTG
jgi:DNA-binding PadR family transcriptional regulator